MIPRSTLILGGARSGKTSRALSLCELFAERYYIATAEAGDAEMSARIAAHKLERGKDWTTIEAPLDLAQAIGNLPSTHNAAVIDCLTLWLSNLIASGRNVDNETAQLCSTIEQASCNLVLVSNEVGLGIVPENALARTFRDHQGRLNQAVAAVVQRVEFVAAGLPILLKG